MEKVALGIDLGTTFTCAAVYQDGAVQVVPDLQGRRIIPSAVTFRNTGRVVAKGEAYQSSSEIANTVFDIKRMMGRSYHDPNVQENLSHWPFTVLKKDSKPAIEVELNGNQSQRIYGSIDDAVITVPAYFNNAQRQATKDAGEIAGFNVLRILSEPTAAILSYQLGKAPLADSRALVFDLGGGTLDVSLLEVKDGMFVVSAISGNTCLGGEDFTTCLVNHFLLIIEKDYQVDIRSDAHALSKLRRECERAKCILSYELEVDLRVDALFQGNDFKSTLQRKQFEIICEHLFKSCEQCIDQLFDENHVAQSEIDQVILSGGSSQMAEIQRFMTVRFGEKCLNTSLSMSEAVAEGAAIQAYRAKLKRDEPDGIVADITPFSLGIEGKNNFFEVLVKRNSPIPVTASMEFTTVSDYQRSVVCSIYEGESLKATKNSLLGSFKLDNIQRRKKGIPILDVAFHLNSSGILTVSEEDRFTKARSQIEINGKKNSLKQTQIAEMRGICQDFEALDVAPGLGKVFSGKARKVVWDRILKSRAS